MLGLILNQAGYDAVAFTDASRAIEHLRSSPCDVAIIAHSIPKLNALQILSQINQLNQLNQLLPKAPLVIFTTDRDWDASKAMKLGIYDFIIRPVDKDELLLTVKNAVRFREIESEIQQLRQDQGGL